VKLTLLFPLPLVTDVMVSQVAFVEAVQLQAGPATIEIVAELEVDGIDTVAGETEKVQSDGDAADA
jgi:hypothetical protein